MIDRHHVRRRGGPHWFLLLSALALPLIVACGDGESGDTGPLALYSGEPSGDDADFRGVLILSGNCLYVIPPGGAPYLVAFPEGTGWDGEEQSVRFSGDTLRVGEQVVLGGGGGSAGAVRPDWAVPPGPACDRSNIWIAG